MKAIPQVFRDNIEPFRCVGVESTSIMIDFNHPFSRYPLELLRKAGDVRDRRVGLGGSCTAWVENMCDGQGMQARWNGRPTDFFCDTVFGRQDEQEDAVFYRDPRLVAHLDSQAIEVSSPLFGELLQPGIRAQNSRLTSRVILDLNRDTRLPFDHGSFDAVVCTACGVSHRSSRGVKGGGQGAQAERRFCGHLLKPMVSRQTIRGWSELHGVERVGLVLEFFLRSGAYGA